MTFESLSSQFPFISHIQFSSIKNSRVTGWTITGEGTDLSINISNIDGREGYIRSDGALRITWNPNG